MERITDGTICSQAAKSHGYTFHDLALHDMIISHPNVFQENLNSCFLRPQRFIPSIAMLPVFKKDLVLQRNESCYTNKARCECTSTEPCFCTTKHYHEYDNTHINRRNTKMNGQFSVSWNLNLGGRESLLEESAFLKAAFEQSVKDYINNDILCSDNLAFKGAEFFGVEIINDSNENGSKKRAVSGNGKCKGDLSKCKKPLKVKSKGKKIGEEYRPSDASKAAKVIHSKADFCDIFLASTIFDAFEERLLTASAFNYNVDVDVLNDLEGNMDLSYDVSFKPAKGDGLDEIDDVDMNPDEPTEINPACTDAQCSTQRDVIKNIFLHFELDFDDDKHECLIQGINCNDSDLVSHIWLGECDEKY